MRAVPLMDATARLLRDHLRESDLDRPERFEQRCSRTAKAGGCPDGGVRYILDKHVQAVRNAHPAFTQSVTPHTPAAY